MRKVSSELVPETTEWEHDGDCRNREAVRNPVMDFKRPLRMHERAARRCCVALPRPWVGGAWGVILTMMGALTSSAMAVSLRELETQSDLSPKKFAKQFETFRYELHRQVQPPNQFLNNRSGDCDDYAILADHLLPRRGYETRLIHIRLAGMIAHAVCYVSEDGVYLDYNNRAVFFRLTKSEPSIRAIADKVADSLNANWTSASEFLYSYETRRKTITATVVRTDDPGNDPPPAKPRPPENSLLVE